MFPSMRFYRPPGAIASLSSRETSRLFQKVATNRIARGESDLESRSTRLADDKRVVGSGSLDIDVGHPQGVQRLGEHA